MRFSTKKNYINLLRIFYSNRFKDNDIPVIDADMIAREGIL